MGSNGAYGVLASQDTTTTAAFRQIGGQYPALSSLRRTVGTTEIKVGNGMGQYGSAVLLEDGIMVGTEHTALRDRMTAYFTPTSAGGFVPLTAQLIYKDAKKDLAFWRLDDPSAVKRLGLQPARFGQSDGKIPNLGKPAVIAGFPGAANGALDAVVATPQEYEAWSKISDPGQMSTKIACKVDADWVKKANYPLNGASGGGVFDPQTGRFLGIFSSDNEHGARFTPDYAVLDAYAKHVPEAAARGYRPVSGAPAECLSQAGASGGAQPGPVISPRLPGMP